MRKYGTAWAKYSFPTSVHIQTKCALRRTNVILTAINVENKHFSILKSSKQVVRALGYKRRDW